MKRLIAMRSVMFVSVLFISYCCNASSIIILKGQEIEKNYSLQNIENKIKDKTDSVSEISGNYVYLVALRETLSADKLQKLEHILQANIVNDLKTTKTNVIVSPRVGTISTWSSKATDILHNCDLSDVIRVERIKLYNLQPTKDIEQISQNYEEISSLFYDRMTENEFTDIEQAKSLFELAQLKEDRVVSLQDGMDALTTANKTLGLALSDIEIDYLFDSYKNLQRDPNDAELMTFAQINSEHCRHKVFNAEWNIGDVIQPMSLFAMIKNTSTNNPNNLLSAYVDNAAVMSGPKGARLIVEPITNEYKEVNEDLPILMKVETHNHPTSISPYPGAATGVGGQIRDEGATGRGGIPKAGLAGFSVSNLRIPNFIQPWERDLSKPDRLASALQIMLEAPLGSAGFNNEFGRPNLTGYLRTYEQEINTEHGLEVRGYHKPIMLAGGMGSIRSEHVTKQAVTNDVAIVVMGGPSMAIGIGGGAASSQVSGSSDAKLDFASVQRDNPEMQRRCQQVINACSAMGTHNPIISIHDVGAGGLSNAIPEIVHNDNLGVELELRDVPNEEPGMTPASLWCNESQERYVLAISKDELSTFKEIAKRERCPVAVVGYAKENNALQVFDKHFNNYAINLPMDFLFANTPRMKLEAPVVAVKNVAIDTSNIKINDAVQRVLSLPTVAEKTFLIHIGDRSVTGLVARDQMVGPWQVPVADCAVTSSSFNTYSGEAMSLGERPPIALIDAAASARMSVGEAITNIAGANIEKLDEIKLSANWQVATKEPVERARLYAAVQAIGMELCPELGISIPVGKDSVSMQAVWQEEGIAKKVTAPLSLNVTAFAPVNDVRATVTPQLRTDKGQTKLLLIDLGAGKNRLGGSSLTQVYNLYGDLVPDVDSAKLLKNYFNAMQELVANNLLLSYHDRSDGGLIVTLLEMAFAGHSGLDLNIDSIPGDSLAILFNEELGGVIQIADNSYPKVRQILAQHGLLEMSHDIGAPSKKMQIRITKNNKVILKDSWKKYREMWAKTTYHMQSLRDNPKTAKEEHVQKLDIKDPGLQVVQNFKIMQPEGLSTTKPKVAILREQGTNGHVEMAAAFKRAGFAPIDVHMSDILSGKVNLDEFSGLVACGGFSYGDVLGAGRGWAMTILHNPTARQTFANFFKRTDTFTLGVCNGCQMLAALKELIPGSSHWPKFVANTSGSFEARVSVVEITPSPSIFLQNMAGSRLPIAVAHAEGRTEFTGDAKLEQSCMHYVDNYGKPATTYPLNPNGSPLGITGLTTTDGRVTILMPHPERVFRTTQNSWHPDDWQEDGPWMQMFYNARKWVG